jgi:hypothetical protein
MLMGCGRHRGSALAHGERFVQRHAELRELRAQVRVRLPQASQLRGCVASISPVASIASISSIAVTALSVPVRRRLRAAVLCSGGSGVGYGGWCFLGCLRWIHGLRLLRLLCGVILGELLQPTPQLRESREEGRLSSALTFREQWAVEKCAYIDGWTAHCSLVSLLPFAPRPKYGFRLTMEGGHFRVARAATYRCMLLITHPHPSPLEEIRVPRTCGRKGLPCAGGWGGWGVH